MRKARFYTLVLAAAMAVAGFAGCSDEEETKPTEQPGEEEISEYLSEGYVPIDWENTKLESYDSTAGQVVLEIEDGKMPAFRKGGSVVIDGSTTSYIRRVKNFTIDGNRVTLETEQGNMADVFRNVKFELSGELSSKAMTKSSDGTLRFHPVEMMAMTEDGGVKRWIRSKADAPIGEIKAYETVIDSTNGTVMKFGGEARIWWKEFRFDASLVPNLLFDFGETEIQDSIGFTETMKKGALRNFGCWFDGNIDWAIVPCFTCKGEFEAKEEIEFEDVIPEISLKFAPFGIPMWINIGTDFVVESSCNLNTELEVYGGARGNWSRRFGFDFHYEYGKGNLVAINDVRNEEYEPVPLTINAKGEMSAGLVFYPRLRMKLYGMIGPTVSLASSFGAECGLGNWEGIGMAYAGLDYTPELLYSLDYEVFGLEGNFGEGKYSFPTFDLCKVPAEVKFISTDKEDVKIGETANVTFQVNACFLDDNYMAVGAGYPVHFNTGNAVPMDAITNDYGQVTVQWTPKEANEELVAMLYGKEYKIIASDTVEMNEPRKIVKIRYTYGGGYSNCDSLVYDEKGRVKSVFAFNAEGEVKETGIKYDEDMVRISYDGDEWLQLYLKDGVVKWGGMDDEVEILCDYTDGYFTGIKYSISDGKIDGVVKGEDIYAHWYFDGMEGNCARVITDIEDEMERGFFIELSEVENNMNLDLFNQETFMLMDLDESWLCGIFGKRAKYLPKSIKWVYEDGSTDVCEYSYKVDEEGYVTEMKAIYSDGALDVLEYIYEE